MNTPTLTTERLIISAFIKEDLEIFSRYRAQPEVARYQSWSEFTYSDALSLFQKTNYANFGVPGCWYQLAIADATNYHLLGDLAVHFIDSEQVEIGFTIAPEYQHQQLAKEAVTALLDYLFNSLNRHRVVATTDTRNMACCRLLEGLGFRREAHFRQNIFFKGAWSDEYQYAMLKNEFISP